MHEFMHQWTKGIKRTIDLYSSGGGGGKIVYTLTELLPPPLHLIINEHSLKCEGFVRRAGMMSQLVSHREAMCSKEAISTTWYYPRMDIDSTVETQSWLTCLHRNQCWGGGGLGFQIYLLPMANEHIWVPPPSNDLPLSPTAINDFCAVL